ncbi:MAG: hypothetical protein M3R35_04720 [Candidatus Eremiobacteraeota bacterium]|nr:hypothetical protein [Candidatus Eremiobacteraeota bacterium]
MRPFSMIVVLAALTTAAAPAASMARYHGTPDLALTSALVQAGGGPAHFHGGQFFGVLLGPHSSDMHAFAVRFGPARTARFARTLTYAIDDSLRVATAAGVTLPAPSQRVATDGALLCAGLARDGTLADGRFDVGYMIEHLVSRPVHVAIMHDINANPAYGPRTNADFHVMLTAAVARCRTKYGL